MSDDAPGEGHVPPPPSEAAPHPGTPSGADTSGAVSGGPVDGLGRPMAAWWQRLVAFALDVAVLAVPTSLIVTAIAGGAVSARATGLGSGGPRVGEAVGLALVVSLGYFSFLDGSRGGQTAGKFLLGIAVRDVDTGDTVGAGRAFGRRLFFFATYLGFGILFLVNALSPLWDPRRQAWHDKIVRSCVVSVR